MNKEVASKSTMGNNHYIQNIKRSDLYFTTVIILLKMKTLSKNNEEM